MSVSRLKAFMQCEAKQYAIEKGEWIDERDNTPLIFGNYVHSKFESEEAHEDFKTEYNDQLFSSRKPHGLLSSYQLAEKVIDTLEKDKLFNVLYHGKEKDKVVKEEIIFGEIEGIPFKGKIDSINYSRGYIVDLKTMKSIHNLEWNDELRTKVPACVNNILTYKYHMQLGVYQELLRQMGNYTFKPFIVAVSKERQPDKEIIEVTETWLSEGLEMAKNAIKELKPLLDGKRKLESCGNCDYCRAHKQLKEIISLDDLIGG
ncbi:hypothetical protein SPJ1_0238 [Streptococcus parauberis KRS-02083]|uniref:Putative exodeoxyribonuclease 8 PDDEXK-like domain-containing protein n=2 Tax=Streptococcus parauberis TaxID=1348 RepID=A0ABN0ITY9_9STRE|nr:hypothetical protein SPJ1_0238 [Streptococcus parauberis KRS-02083]